MIKVSIGDVFIVEKVPSKKMLKGTAWKVIKYDTKTKHYQMENVNPNTGRKISGRVDVSYDLKEIETMVKRNEIKKL